MPLIRPGFEDSSLAIPPSGGPCYSHEVTELLIPFRSDMCIFRNRHLELLTEFVFLVSGLL